MAYKCMLCHNDIEKWQSYHCDAQGIKHMACESNRTPPAHSSSYFYGGEKARMTLGDEGVSPHKKEDVEPPLGGGGKGNHRTKRTHTKSINGHSRQYKVKKEEFDDV